MKHPADVALPGLSAEQVERLHAFEGLLASQGRRAGVVGPDESNRMWTRHILDSLRALPCLGSQRRSMADVGSGGGLPGIPVAIAVPDASITLIEPRVRRAAFLEAVVERLGLLNVEVLCSRAEDVHGPAVDACTARSLAPPGATWATCRHLLGPGGIVLYWAGRSWPANAPSPEEARCEVCVGASRDDEGPIVMMSRPEERPRTRKEDEGNGTG